MLIFRLCSIFDDWPSNPRDESRPKCEKMATKSSKNEMLVFGLRSTSDDRLSSQSDKSCPKCEKMAAKSSKNCMLVVALLSTSDDWPCNPSDKSWLKCGKIDAPPPPKMKKSWKFSKKKLMADLGRPKFDVPPPTPGRMWTGPGWNTNTNRPGMEHACFCDMHV